WNRCLSAAENALLAAAVKNGLLPLVFSPAQSLFQGKGSIAVLMRSLAAAEAQMAWTRDHNLPGESARLAVKGGPVPAEWLGRPVAGRDGAMTPLESGDRVATGLGAHSPRRFIRRLARPRRAAARLHGRRVFFPRTSPTSGLAYFEASGAAVTSQRLRGEA